MDGVRKSLIYSAPASRRILGWAAAIFLVWLICFFAWIAVLGIYGERTDDGLGAGAGGDRGHGADGCEVAVSAARSIEVQIGRDDRITRR
jgi:hypothetical protein